MRPPYIQSFRGHITLPGLKGLNPKVVPIFCLAGSVGEETGVGSGTREVMES